MIGMLFANRLHSKAVYNWGKHDWAYHDLCGSLGTAAGISVIY
jgi:hypothetical protein